MEQDRAVRTPMGRAAADGSPAHPSDGSRPAALTALRERLAVAPVERGVGTAATALSPGRVRLEVPLRPDLVGADGTVNAAVLTTTADCAIGMSVHSSVPGSRGGPTVELRLDHVGPVGAGARTLIVDGSVVHSDTRTGAGRAVLTDDTGVLVAHAVGTMAVDPLREGVPALGDAAAPGGGEAFDPVGLAALAGADPDGDPAELRMTVRGSMSNLRGKVHGGVLMGFAHVAQDRFQAAHGVAVRRVSCTVDYLRPVPLDAGELVCRSEFVRRGRRFWTVRTTVSRSDGKPVALAAGTGVLLAP
ncbi:hotdog fold thioesterase [Pseudonocardia bannensis]|uniref:PaaI family thioesterase n=1 Tax=Pseudonocardia bannensis TaxID=630973 RepID=A0A848DPI1_9PSEU|nr:PaaI family thioesterase [Pseudonocardia bannensis]NMH94692.1 PaaI family thioesterase [Pseudonocardia bannensis]